MARLTITAHARADLREIHSHIAKDNPGAARRFVERLRTKARQLAEIPAWAAAAGRICVPICFRSRSVITSSFTASSQAGSYSYALFTAAATCLHSLAALNPSGPSAPLADGRRSISAPLHLDHLGSGSPSWRGKSSGPIWSEEQVTQCATEQISDPPLRQMMR